MDALALSRKLDSLEKSWSGLDSLLNFWTLLVVAGVVIEVFVLVIDTTQVEGFPTRDYPYS